MIITLAFPFLIQGAALGLSAAASPGPLQTYLINQTLSGGWRRGAPVAFAPLISDLPVVVVILLLLDQLPVHFINIISTIGGIFALYLCFNLWQKWRHANSKLGNNSSQDLTTSLPNPTKIDDHVSGQTKSGSTLPILVRAVLLNLLSPGLYMFWSLVNGPILLSALRQSILLGFAFLFSFYLVLLSGMLALVVVFHFARRLGSQVVRILTLASIIVLGVMGFYLIYKGVSPMVASMNFI